MEECKGCELAVYCYSDSNTWVFRTKQEMDEKLAEIEECPVYEQVKQAKAGESESEARSGAGAG
jgi:hypothetical protein